MIKQLLILTAIYSLFFFPQAAAAEEPRTLSPLYSIHDLPMSPIFTYSDEELSLFKNLRSEFSISSERLEKWDQSLNDYLRSKSKAFGEETRTMTYLYAAQRDFAFLSLKMKGKMEGSIDAISLDIIRLFHPFFSFDEELKIDAYSRLLSRMIFKKYKARFNAEAKKEEDFQNFASLNWQNYNLYYGKNILNWIPWKLPIILIKTTMPPTDSEEEWQSQVDAVLDVTQNLTENQKKSILYWADFYPYKWLDLLNFYMFSHNVPLEKIIYIRSFMAMALYDALIYSYDLKYTYMIKPPFLQDKRIKPTIPIEHPYPSYPSSQAMVAEVSSLVLSYFFPDEKGKWESLARQNGQSRLWAGVNYPLDIEEARRLARTIFDESLAADNLKPPHEMEL